ncbi:MAG: ABC transporter substrate-binding protein [Eubacteriales bacterium]|nr:ABC transporter substrate-binding protein [Eubacteriales bacterium]
MKKRVLSVFIVIMAVGVLLLSGCSSQKAESKALPKVGIVQITDHPSLNEIRESIVAEMAEEGFVDGETIKIDYKNAQNDPNNLKTICQTFVSGEVDLIIAIATPSAQSALSETGDIPIIFSAVTDPVEAGLVENMEIPGQNITGTSDKVSAEKIMNLARKITPDIKTIGALYNPGETNSVSVINDLKEYASENNLKIVEATVTNTNEVQQSTQYLASRVDAVFSPIDNTVASAMAVVTDELEKAKIPFYAGADSMVKDGALATYGINYTILGKETGTMVSKVLNGEKISEIPVKTMSEMKIYINSETAKKIQITFPEEIIKKAQDLAN